MSANVPHDIRKRGLENRVRQDILICLLRLLLRLLLLRLLLLHL